MRILHLVASTLFVICIPVLLFTSNARGAINSLRLHEYGYNKYEAVTSTNIEKQDLIDVAKGLIYYFNLDQELTVADHFNKRELAHLVDVKNLIRFFYRIQEATLVYAILYIIFGFLICKRRWWKRVGKGLIWGSGLTLAAFAMVGITLAIDFDGLFTWFHEVSFNNKLWVMLPSDLLSILYPEAFFFEVSLFVVIATIIECLFIGGFSVWYICSKRRSSVASVTTGRGA